MGLQDKATEKVHRYIDKASDKFGSMSMKKQCKTYLSLLTVNKLMGFNVHKSFLDGTVSDYQEENAKSPISVDDWLKPYYDEPLFAEVLKRCKTNREELEKTLKKGKEI
jgi:hypothetical protein